MGTRGPPPTPTNVLKRRGSWRGNRNPHEPTPPPGKPRCPRWLSDEAKRAWKRMIPQLDAMGILTRLDGHALARYCQLWARWRQAEEFLATNGDTHLVRNADGQVAGVRAYPQVKIAAQLAEQLLRIEQQFGMTPSARTRLVAPQPTEQHQDDKSRYLRVGG
jgi:P27 family predicted phage terminase small subunit